MVIYWLTANTDNYRPYEAESKKHSWPRGYVIIENAGNKIMVEEETYEEVQNIDSLKCDKDF